MKKILLFLVVFLSLSQSHLLAQDWGEVGTKWVYSVTSWSTPKLYQFEVEKDTVINNTPCKKIIKKVLFLSLNPDNPNEITGSANSNDKYYYRASNDSIFWFNNNEFEFLYNFSPQINDTWITQENLNYLCTNQLAPSSAQIVNDIKNDTLLDGTILSATYLTEGTAWTLGAVIYKDIGPEMSPFPLPGVDCGGIDIAGSQGNRPSRILCFSGFDQTVNFLPETSDLTCQEILPVFDLIKADIEKQYIVYPNPSTGILHIDNVNGAFENQGYTSARLYDVLGQTVLFQENLLGQTLDIATFPRGTYFLELSLANSAHSETHKIIKL